MGQSAKKSILHLEFYRVCPGNRPHTFIAVNLLTRQKIVNSVIAGVGLLIHDAQYLQYFCSLILSALTFYVHICWLMTPGGHHRSEHHI